MTYILVNDIKKIESPDSPIIGELLNSYVIAIFEEFLNKYFEFELNYLLKIIEFNVSRVLEQVKECDDPTEE